MMDLLKARNIAKRIFWPSLIGICLGSVTFYGLMISARHKQAIKKEQICLDEIQRLTKDDPRKKIVSIVVYDNEFQEGHFAPDFPIKVCYCSTLERYKTMLKEGFIDKVTTQTAKEKRHEKKIDQVKSEKR